MNYHTYSGFQKLLKPFKKKFIAGPIKMLYQAPTSTAHDKINCFEG